MKETIRHKSGFTLIELLVVIAIIGLIATMAVVSFGNARDKAKAASILANFKNIEKGMALYKESLGLAAWWRENTLAGTDPEEISNILNLNPAMRDYLPQAPTDGNYQYDNDGNAYDPDGDGCGPWSGGVGIFLFNLNNDDVAEALDQMVDDGDGGTCGKILYQAGSIDYIIASDENSAAY